MYHDVEERSTFFEYKINILLVSIIEMSYKHI
jgi:hypothetical protein